jgi:monoamine oxidase
VSGSLGGVHVFVVGAGLAGLSAARDLTRCGALVTVADARRRVGGRVWTIRAPFAHEQHAESGGDFIDAGHDEIQQLVKELGLKLTRILNRGWGFVRADRYGRARIVRASNGWSRLAKSTQPLGRLYRLAEKRWDSPIVADLSRRSVARWLDDIGADRLLREAAIGFRGFFLADPEELSLVALVDQFAANESPVDWTTYRIDGGNDRLAAALAAPLGERLALNTEVVAVTQRAQGAQVSVKSGTSLSQIKADYVLFAAPATLLRRIPITPALPAQQHDAIARLAYGRGTKTLLQFSRRFWRVAGRPAAFGSTLPFGALWDGSEEQRGPAGILSLLAGGSASDATNAILAKEGAGGLARSLSWLGSESATLVTAHHTAWESESWSRGGYAFFDPSYDPALRPWLARPAGRLFFAGEHTSVKWQGYMNGAVESGRRAAAEIDATHRLRRP